MTERTLPPVRYTRTTDGVSIAYMVWPGDSPAFIQVPTPGMAPYLAAKPDGWVMKGFPRFARGRSQVLFDWRGTGQSERRPASSMEELALDLEAVVGALGEAPDLFATQGGCFPACTFVAQHPEACRSLTLVSPMIRWSESPLGTFTRGGYHDYEVYLYSLARTFFPSLPEDEFDWLVRTWPREVPEPVHRAYMALLDAADLTSTLPTIEVPALVVRGIRAPAASKVAALIPRSVLTERDDGMLGVRADWDEHIGSKFGDSRKPAATVPNGLLTEQEQRVLALVANGRTNAQIAEALTIAESTVARHVHNILTKLDLSNRVAAAAWWLAHRP